MQQAQTVTVLRLVPLQSKSYSVDECLAGTCKTSKCQNVELFGKDQSAVLKLVLGVLVNQEMRWNSKQSKIGDTNTCKLAHPSTRDLDSISLHMLHWAHLYLPAFCAVVDIIMGEWKVENGKEPCNKSLESLQSLHTSKYFNNWV